MEANASFAAVAAAVAAVEEEANASFAAVAAAAAAVAAEAAEEVEAEQKVKQVETQMDETGWLAAIYPL